MATKKKKAKSQQTKKPSAKKSTLPVKKKLPSQTVQKKILNDFFSNTKPSEEIEAYWIYASRQKGSYPKSNANSGKWLIFVSVDNIDTVWEKIKLATESGLLGGGSKVSTAKPNPNAAISNMKVICVYTYDYTDKEDVMRVRQELRKIGVISKIPYKTDNATRQGQYQVKGNTRISVYYE
jgi:hypothetical protein